MISAFQSPSAGIVLARTIPCDLYQTVVGHIEKAIPHIHMTFSLGGSFISVCYLNYTGFSHTNHCVVDSSPFRIHSIHYRLIKRYYMLLFSSESCGELLCNGIKSRLYQVMVLFQVTVDYCTKAFCGHHFLLPLCPSMGPSPHQG